jgi:hypothetical protein
MSTNGDAEDGDDGPSVETRLDAIAHYLGWIDRDRLGMRPKLWVWMVEWLLTVFGAIILVGLAVGVSGVISWDAVVAWLDDPASLVIGLLAVLTFLSRAVWTVSEWRDRSRENRSLIETGTGDDQ